MHWRDARITWIDERVSLAQILEQRANHRAWPLHARALDDLRRQEARDALKRLVVAGFGAMQAMMFATVLYLRGAEAVDISAEALFRWLGFIMLVAGVRRTVLQGAARSIAAASAWMFRRRPHRSSMPRVVEAGAAAITSPSTRLHVRRSSCS